MFKPTFKDFQKKAAAGNMIPVFREQLADTETPVSVLARFSDEKHVFLLESVEGGENWGRYSVIGLNPSTVFTVEKGEARVTERDGHSTVLPHDSNPPLFRLREIIEQVKPVVSSELPRFFAGAVGYIGYETVNQFEKMPPPKNLPEHPETCLMMAGDLIVFDNVRHTMIVVACARIDRFNNLQEAYDDACRRIVSIEERLCRPPVIEDVKATGSPADLETHSNMEPEQFRSMVEKAREYIAAGDIIQTVLSQRFTVDSLAASPLSVYRALRLINPSPYLFYVKNKDHILLGSSPEIMVKLTGSTVELRPIAGTRPRGTDEQKDRAMADELLNDEKERAEHVMLVDLGRNDLGRVAVPGSVQVRDFMTVERYSHVMHIVSHLQAELGPEYDAFEVIRSVFPAGTLSGAPKIRAMEIIQELEPQARGVYGGAVGFIGYNGDVDLAIAIRTIELSGSQAAIQAGAGIVADSDPENEYQETCRKAQGMVNALKLAAGKLDLNNPDIG